MVRWDKRGAGAQGVEDPGRAKLGEKTEGRLRYRSARQEMERPAIGGEACAGALAQRLEGGAGVDGDVLSGERRVVPPGTRARVPRGQQLGAEEQRVSLSQHLSDLFRGIHEVLEDLESGDKIESLPARLRLEAHAVEVRRVPVAPSEVETAVAHEAHETTVSAAVIEKTSARIEEELND